MDGKKKSLRHGRLGARIGALLEEHAVKRSPRNAWMSLAAAPIAFLLGHCALPFSVYPLGLALLCASTEKTLLIAAGLVAAAFSLPFPPLLPICVTLGTLAVRILARVFIDLPVHIGGDGRPGEVWEHLRGRLFCEGLYLRMACVCVSVFSMSLYAIIAGGFRYYDLFGALFSMVIAPLSVFLFAGLFEGEADRLFDEHGATILRRISHVAIAVAVCYSLADVSLAGVPVAVGFAFMATLALCRQDGFFAALAVGVLGGLLVNPLTVPVFAAATFTAYCIQDASPTLAAAVSCIAGTVTAIPFLGSSTVGTVFLPLLAATVIYCALDKLAHRAVPVTETAPPPPTNIAAHQLRAQTASAMRLADTLTELSSAFSALSKQQKKPSSSDMRLLCDTCFDELCADCSTRSDCWEKHYHTMLDTTDRLVESLRTRGHLTVHDLPDTLYRSCVRTDRLLARLNDGMADLVKSTLCAESTEIFSLDYGNTATLLRELCAAVEIAFREDEKSTSVITSRLKALGYTAAEVSVTGERQKCLTVSNLQPTPDRGQLDYIGGQLSRACGYPLSDLVLDEDGRITASRAAAFEVTYGSNFSAHETVCGDVLSVFRDDGGGYLCAILNDGMGAGKEAAFTAQLASLFLRKLLPAGVRPETALRMLNHFLRLGRNRGSTESSTTVDLLMLDLLQGRAVFLKSGAAPTYVKRGKNIFYLDSGTAPVGILPELDAKQIDFEVRDGDIIVMVSDGVTGGDGECLWLLDYLDATPHDDPATLAKHIVADAAERGNTDDLSAIVLRIKKK